jgi:anti-sigma factor RsiW
MSMNLDDEDLSARIRRHATRHPAPHALRAAIRTQITLAEAGRAAPPAAPQASRRPWFGHGWRAAAASLRWRTATLGFALGLAFAMLVVPIVQRIDEPAEAELVAGHVRALKIGPLIEVASSDRHTVKPWFQGRVDYAPPVFDLGAEGFPLIGGRIDHVRGDTVAALAYMSNRHVIDLFVWPGSAQTPPVHSVHKGFNVLRWADGSMQYWAVSDVERAELERFAKLWQQRAAAQ